MSIFRTRHNKNFTTINNFICKDNRLSWKAKGIWLYAFSRPDDWIFYLNDLVNQSTDGKDSVRAGLKELENCGYLRRTKNRGEDGKFSDLEWDFHETPEDFKKIVPQTDFPTSDNPTLENPTSGNPPLLKTDCLPSTESLPSIETTTKQVVVFFDCLKDLEEPEEDKLTLMKHPEEKLIKGIRYMKSLKTQPDNPIGYLHWYCESDKDLEPIDDSTSQQKLAKKFNEELREKGSKVLYEKNLTAIPEEKMYLLGEWGEQVTISLKNEMDELKKDFNLCRQGIEFRKQNPITIERK